MWCARLSSVLGLFLVVATAPAQDLSFALDVQPILAKRCFACHGPADQEAGLALNDPAVALAELDSGDTAIVAGDPDASQLLQRVSSDDAEVRMPPEGKPLTIEEIATLRQWIAQGAKYEKHWSFVKPGRPLPPEVRDPSKVNNAIDRFVLAKLEAIGLEPATRAEPGKLVRRLYLDLTGLLPPTEKVAAFREGKVSYSQIVDELLASEHFGERWGRHWLDLARYADTFGYERDDIRPNAWRYRDWVVNSINRNQSYDRFLVEQLAGDLIENATLEQRIATGLHRMNIHNNEAGINKEDYRNRETVDRVNTTSTAMLGLTLGCCQCHSHKYDPFSHRDYYSFYAFFNNIETKDTDIEGTPAEQQKYLAAKGELDKRRKLLDERGKLLGELRKRKSAHDWLRDEKNKPDVLVAKLDLDEELKLALAKPVSYKRQLAEFWSSLSSRQDETKKSKRQLSVQERHLPKPYVMQLAERSKDRRATYVLKRGDFKQRGEKVVASPPEVLPTFSARGETPDRLDLAEWIVSSDNPLVARVAVNHLWKHLFGRGIVISVDDFGTQGQPPTHPKLLDWLAVQFMESGWDRKQLIRTIVHSATYQQSSAMRRSEELEQQNAFGPDNSLFARQSRFRVEAEIVRDVFLDASGLLHRQVGGPTIHPLAPSAIRDLGYKYKTRWIVSDRPNRYRRGLYIHFKRTNPYPTLIMFDGPESNVCQAMRNRSNTPLQALATLNDPVFVECAQALGSSLANRDGKDSEKLHTVAKRSLSRELAEREVSSLVQLLDDERKWFADRDDDAKAFVGEYKSEGTSLHETAAWIAVSRAILNLDEFVTRE